MDIAKIRKKAQEKAKGTQVKQAPEAASREEKPQDLSSGPEEPGGPEAREPQEVAQEAVAMQDEPVAADQERELAEESGDEAPEKKIELLTFNISGREFAFRLGDVEEIIRYQQTTRVPVLPSYVRGITSLRGKIIPVIDAGIRLAVRNGDKAAPETAGKGGNEKIVILSGPGGLIGALVDKVLGVIRFPEKDLLDPPAHLSEAELKFVEGVVVTEGRFISVVRSEDTMNVEVS